MRYSAEKGEAQSSFGCVASFMHDLFGEYTSCFDERRIVQQRKRRQRRVRSRALRSAFFASRRVERCFS